MINLLAACPPVYTLPGTWDDPEKIKRCQETLIPHLQLEPETGFLIFVGLLVLGSIIYGLYMTFGSGGKDLRDEIKEHARMHEMGIAHGHNEGGSYVSTREIDNPRHKHD
tara:strand:- start:698 stop:1027 length:330 start_codon:yes stop_codon:yes gene_type:complete